MEKYARRNIHYKRDKDRDGSRTEEKKKLFSCRMRMFTAISTDSHICHPPEVVTEISAKRLDRFVIATLIFQWTFQRIQFFLYFWSLSLRDKSFHRTKSQSNHTFNSYCNHKWLICFDSNAISLVTKTNNSPLSRIVKSRHSSICHCHTLIYFTYIYACKCSGCNCELRNLSVIYL